MIRWWRERGDQVLDRAIQMHGGAGVSQDFHLAMAYAHARAIRFAAARRGARDAIAKGSCAVRDRVRRNARPTRSSLPHPPRHLPGEELAASDPGRGDAADLAPSCRCAERRGIGAFFKMSGSPTALSRNRLDQAGRDAVHAHVPRPPLHREIARRTRKVRGLEMP